MNIFKGTHTAIITPFDRHDRLDEEGLRLLVQRQMECGIDGIIFIGTTGEAPTLTHEEQKRIIAIAKEECGSRVNLIVGTGTYSTQQTIENTLLAEEMGADGALLITPYYNRPTQEGVVRHFKTLSEQTSLPLCVYNNPIRTGLHVQLDTFKRLMEIPSMAAIKDCSGNIGYVSDIIEAARQCRPEFSILTGDDSNILPVMALGGHGVISTVGNLVPKEIVNLVRALLAGDYESARWMHYQLMPLIHAIGLETNPIGIKAALDLCGLPAGPCRLPLCPLSAENAKKLAAVINQNCSQLTKINA